MTSDPPEQITALLHRWSEGDSLAGDALFPLVYAELRRLARRRMARERPDHTLQGTALVNEAFLRLSGQQFSQWKNRRQFLALASQMMRRVLVDHARQRAASKRGAGAAELSLDDTSLAVAIEAALAGEAKDKEREADNTQGLLGIHAALERLAAFDPQQSQIVELRYFGGLSIEETADVVGLSPATIKREWALARAWLRRELSRSSTVQSA